MSSFSLRILTPDSVVLDQKVEKIIVRTTEGDVGILRNHANYIAGIKNGPISVFFVDGSKEIANIKEGFISVLDGEVIIMVLSYDKL